MLWARVQYSLAGESLIELIERSFDDRHRDHGVDILACPVADEYDQIVLPDKHELEPYWFGGIRDYARVEGGIAEIQLVEDVNAPGKLLRFVCRRTRTSLTSVEFVPALAGQGSFLIVNQDLAIACTAGNK